MRSAVRPTQLPPKIQNSLAFGLKSSRPSRPADSNSRAGGRSRGGAQSGAAGLRTTADIVDQFNEDPAATVRVRDAADRIDRAAAALDDLRGKVRAVKLTRELIALIRAAIAGAELPCRGAHLARQAIAVARVRTAELRDEVVSDLRRCPANTVVWL